MLLLRRRHKTTVRKVRRPGPRGHYGRGGGAWSRMKAPSTHRGTSNDIAGLYPFMLGSGAPMIGVPLGRVKRKNSKGSVVCCDPLSWFERAHLIHHPAAFILGQPGLGKSSLVKRWVIGMDNFGTKSMVLGDLKGEYVKLISALGGQVISVGRGRGFINPLDMGEALDAVQRLRDAGQKDAASKLLAEAKGRRQAAIETLLTIHRTAMLLPREATLLSEALRVLDTRITRRVPILADLLKVVKNPTPAMHKVSLSRGDSARYQEITEHLEADLESLAAGHGLGEIFNQETTTHMRRGEHMVFDVSSIGDEDQKLQAAALILCWNIGFGQVAVSNALADAGLEPSQPVHIVLDELWRVLRAGPGLTDRVDGLTRLDRDKGVAVTFVTHTMEDLSALPTAADVAKAIGLVERCGLVIAFGLPASEMPRLSKAVKLNNREQKTLSSWTTPLSWSRKSKKKDPPPGRGNCLIKVGSRNGIAIHIDLTDMELEFNETSKRFAA